MKCTQCREYLRSHAHFCQRCGYSAYAYGKLEPKPKFKKPKKLTPNERQKLYGDWWDAFFKTAAGIAVLVGLFYAFLVVWRSGQ